MADEPRYSGKPPDYEGYTRGVKADVSKRQQAAKKYAREGARGELDFTTEYKDSRAAPGWIVSEKRSGESPDAVVSRYNKFARGNRQVWKKEADAREAYDKGDGGIRHYDTKDNKRTSKRKSNKRG